MEIGNDAQKSSHPEADDPHTFHRRINALEHQLAELRLVNKELRITKEFLENIINALDDPVFVKDDQHRWVLLNDKLCQIIGHVRADLIGKSDYDISPKEQADVFWEKDEHVLKTGETSLNEEMVTWHGELHTIATKKSLFINSFNGKKYIAGTIRDITKLKMLEQEREKYIVDLKKALAKIEAMSKRDFLTNLFNRKGILEIAVSEMKRAARIRENVRNYLNKKRRKNDSSPKKKKLHGNGGFGVFSCVMVDIDFFKKINDAYGHLIGDKVLREVGAVLSDKKILRESDVAGRFGGEEFLIIFPETSCKDALVPLDKIIEQIKQLTFTSDKRKKFGITVSAGIAQYRKIDTNIDAVIKRADQALYYAKEHGKDRIVVYRQYMHV